MTRVSVCLVQRYLPSPFVFSILLTLLTLASGLVFTQQSLPAMLQHWNQGFWALLVIGLPLINRAMHPRGRDVVQVNTALLVETESSCLRGKRPQSDWTIAACSA